MRKLVAVVALAGLVLLAGVAGADEEAAPPPAGDAEHAALEARAEVLPSLIIAAYRARRFEEADRLAREDLALREALAGPESMDVAGTLYVLGLIAYQQRRWEDARAYNARGLTIREAVLGEDHVKLVKTLGALALAEGEMNHLVEAETHLARALAIQEGSLGLDDPTLSTLLNNLGGLRERQGRPREAISCFERVIALRTRVLGPDHPNVALALTNLAATQRAAGDSAAALPLNERALAILRGAPRADPLLVAQVLTNLAGAYSALGRYAEALPAAEEALAIREQRLPAGHPYRAKALASVAAIHQSAGRLVEAREYLERAVVIAEAAPDGAPFVQAEVLLELSGLLCQMGHVAPARPLCARALALIEAREIESSRSVITARAQFSDMLMRLGETDLAREQAGKLAAYLAAAGDRPTHTQAMAWSSLGVLWEGLGELDAARDALQRAVEMTETVLGPEHPMLRPTLCNLALNDVRRGKPKEGLPHAERALALSEAAVSSDPQQLGNALSTLAQVELALGHGERAAAFSRRCLETREQHVRRHLVTLQGAERYGAAQRLRGALGTHLAILDRLGEPGYEAVLRVKGLLTRVTAAERVVARRRGAGLAASTAGLVAAERQLAQLANAMPPRFRAEAFASWQRAYAHAAADRERLATALAGTLAPLRAEVERLDVDAAALQARLAPGEVLVDVLRSGGRYVAWVLGTTGDVARVDLGDASVLEAAAEAFVAALADPARAEVGVRGEALRGLVVDPIRPHLPRGTTTLLVCPDAALAIVPLGALPGARGGTVLADEFRVGYVSMAQALAVPEDRAARGTGALLLGAVDYEHAAAPDGETSFPVLAGPVVAHRAPRGGRFVPLQATAAEIEKVASCLDEPCATLRGSEAMEAALPAAVRGKRLLHLATHGYVRDDLFRGLTRRGDAGAWLGANAEWQLAAGHDPLLLTGLALAGANPREGGYGHDGILTALEASHLDLRGVELVVLSACETARGRATGGEGVVGLVRAFRMAGADQVLGSLWRVDDEATRALMAAFHEHWGAVEEGVRVSAAAALRRAQAHVRKDPRWTHPCYWAAWVLWGRAAE